MQIYLLPFIIEALRENSTIYKEIDKLYQKNKYEFYILAKNHELYNHQIIKEGSLIQEEYSKKILGILLKAEEDEETYNDLMKIIKKGFKYSWTYFENNKKIDFEDFAFKFKRKYKSLDDPLGNPIEHHCIILILLSIKEEKKLIENDLYRELMKNLYDRWTHYNDDKNTRISIDKISDIDIEKIAQMKKDIEEKYLKISNFENIISSKINKEKLDVSAFLFDYEELSSISIFRGIDFTEKDIDEILFLYLLKEKESQSTRDVTEFLISNMYIKYLIKAYKEVKAMYFENNKETMFAELDSMKISLNSLKRRLFAEKEKNIKLEEKLKIIEKEKERLENELEIKKRNDEELYHLREYVFNMDKELEYVEDKDINFKMLENFKCVIVGGHEKWQQRMKTYLPNFIFIHPDNKNFDVKLLSNIDYLFIYVNYLNHGLYYRVMEGTYGKKIKIRYINQQNENIVLRQIYNICMNLPLLL